MKSAQSLSDFFDAIDSDGRISTTHIGLYAAILHYWRLQDFKIPFFAYSYDIMKIAKVSARVTYVRCIRDLHQFGYLKYEPSFKRNRASKIWVSQPEPALKN
jgi:hypothetical protein